MSTPAGRAFSARVTGIVQGVGFRYAAVHEARRLGVKGFVRNVSDGSVEAVGEGDARAVTAFLAWLEIGPPGATVHRVTVTEVPYAGRFDRFSVEF